MVKYKVFEINMQPIERQRAFGYKLLAVKLTVKNNN